MNEIMNRISRDVRNELYSMGISLEEIDESHCSKSKEYNCNYFIFDTHISYTNYNVPINKVVGSLHPRYKGLSLLDTFINLERRRRIVLDYIDNKKYYTETLISDKSDTEYDRPEFIKINDEYFVDTGNHRVTICKLKNINLIKACVTEYIMNPHKEKLWNDFSERGFKLGFLKNRKLGKYRKGLSKSNALFQFQKLFYKLLEFKKRSYVD
ncbi:hypothetical protein [Paenibacillus popilliae]|uniref:ParB/Sulfiredoxin domain-containing protein n=1 Tax=Paenibacillus popilliae TaxID=78057 RepID=A0ABY3AXR7_PAEPP|nr:hypothetical protein [Paenibacillus sp. SDF0028]TQR47206.1 hypothetical protein C7Y44_06225 [Paenibacillus sp. SDF0028]